MKKSSRIQVYRLAEKLLQIRLSLGLSQNELLHRLGFSDELFRSSISHYELGERTPPLPVLLRYAELANVWVDVLIDDELDLPAKIPSSKRHEGKARASKVKKRNT